MSDNLISIARVCDNSKQALTLFIEKGVKSDNAIQLQGYKQLFLLDNIVSLDKADGLKNAYYMQYNGILDGVKVSQLKNYSKIDFAKFIDNEIDSFNAFLDNTAVKVIRDTMGKTQVIASDTILIYYC